MPTYTDCFFWQNMNHHIPRTPTLITISPCLRTSLTPTSLEFDGIKVFCLGKLVDGKERIEAHAITKVPTGRLPSFKYNKAGSEVHLSQLQKLDPLQGISSYAKLIEHKRALRFLVVRGKSEEKLTEKIAPYLLFDR
jgi:hypothetical protein